MGFDLSNWGWPQWTIGVLWVISLLIIAAVNGKPKTGEYNFALSFMAIIIYSLLLGFGGFWA